MIKSTKSLLLLILFLTSPISSMHQFTLPSLNDKNSSLMLFCCAAAAIGLSYLGYKWINSPKKNLINNIIPPTTIIPITTTNINSLNELTKSSAKTIDPQLWVQTSDDITLSIDIKNYLPKSGLRYLLEQYKQCFSHYNNEQAPLKIGRSLYDLKLLQTACHYLKSNITKFNFNNAQQGNLLEMASTFKIHKLYLALLNTNILSEINIQKINPYCITLDHGTTPLFNEIMKIVITLINKNTITWSTHKQYFTQGVHSKKYTFDHKYKLCAAWRYQQRYNYYYDKSFYDGYVIWDNQNSNYIKNQRYPKSFYPYHGYHIFPRKNLILITGRPGSANPRINPFIYDITNNKEYDLGIDNTPLGETAISPDENYIAICSSFFHCPEKNNSIYVFNISDLNNIKQYQPLQHQNVMGITFSPDSKLLVSAGKNVELWDINNLDNTTVENYLSSLFCSNNSIKPKTLLQNVTCNSLVFFNKDNVHLFIVQQTDFKKILPTILNINEPEKYKIIESNGNCCNFKVFPENSDFIVYEEHYEDHNAGKFLKIINKEGTELFSHEYGRYHSITTTISDNLQHIAVNTKFHESFPYPRDYINFRHLITIKEKLVTIKSPKIQSKCKAINDDGSFWTNTSFYDSTLKCIITLDYSNPKSKTTPYTQPIIFYDNIKKIKPLLENITPLQYDLIKKACNAPREKGSLLSIKQDSLYHYTLKSFGAHGKLLTDTLKLQITS